MRTTISNCSGEPVSLETSHLSFLRLIWVTHCLRQTSAPVPKAKSCSRKQNFPCEYRGREESPTASTCVNKWCSLSSAAPGVHFLYFFYHLVGIPLLWHSWTYLSMPVLGKNMITINNNSNHSYFLLSISYTPRLCKVLAIHYTN